ncbi:hypothetical protein niasHT_035276 [Heterodera trifolii]|uniref:Uncharacterized protein n=1 Tax=Heterodera trifolii TaxID=157864 RepID=A0ABD2IXL1_9BILA
MENDEVPPRDSYDNDEDYEEARRLSAARIRADEERIRIQTRNAESSLFKDDEKYFHGLDNRIYQTKELDAQVFTLSCYRSRRLPTDRCVCWRRLDWRDRMGNPGRHDGFCRWLKAVEEALNGGGGEMARFVPTAHLRLVFSTQLLAQVNSSRSESMNC